MTLPAAGPDNKTLVLGTALWGWSVDRETAHAMLGAFREAGGRIIDVAPNYPINKRPQDYQLAVRWVAEWLRANPGHGMSVLLKIGSMDNLGGPDANLGRSFVHVSVEIFQGAFGEALQAMAVHWDNREDPEEIADTLGAMRRVAGQGISIGFSGVKRPDLYRAGAPDLADQWWIQVKENAQTAAARQSYTPHFPNARYLAYGINMGGVKLEENASADSSVALRKVVRPEELVQRMADFIKSGHGLAPRPESLNHIALASAWFNTALSGVILGPRTMEQLTDSISFWRRLREEATPAMARELASLSAAG